MPLLVTPYPHVMNSINGPTAPPATFLIFYSSIVDGQMWCPDCRAVEGIVKKSFDGPEKPKAIIHWVGNKTEWRTPSNEARTKWNVNYVPTILRLENGKETARVTDVEILDSAQWKNFLAPGLKSPIDQ